MGQSILARTIERLLDETHHFNRKGWSGFLGVSQEAFDRWIHDEELPSADTLHTIYEALERSSNCDPALMREFERIKRLPARKISPHGAYLGKNLEQYLLQATISEERRSKKTSEYDDESYAHDSSSRNGSCFDRD
jgi:hypothetical protein